MPEVHRRDVLKGMAAGAVALTTMGVASAADGRVALVAAESAEEVSAVSGVKDVTPNQGYRPVGPELQSTAESKDEEYADVQWDKHADTTGAFEAHDVATGEGRTVAIIDTGIDTYHPDLRNSVGEGALFRADGASSPDGSPTVDGDATIQARLKPEAEEVAAYTFLGEPKLREQTAADDVDSHGSHCAGIATARNGDTAAGDTAAGEDFGIAGVAPDAEVVPLRVFYWKQLDGYPYDVDEDGEEESVTVTTLWTTDFDILNAIDYASEIGV